MFREASRLSLTRRHVLTKDGRVLEYGFYAVSGVVVVLTMPFPSFPPLHRVFANLRYRKLLSGKKIEYPSLFPILGVYKRGATPFQVLWL